MRTSEVAAQAHVNAQTLRYDERRGLLPEPERTHRGYRAYTADAVRVVRFAKRAQQLGFTLKDIEDLYTWQRVDPPPATREGRWPALGSPTFSSASRNSLACVMRSPG